MSDLHAAVYIFILFSCDRPEYAGTMLSKVTSDRTPITGTNVNYGQNVYPKSQ